MYMLFLMFDHCYPLNFIIVIEDMFTMDTTLVYKY